MGRSREKALVEGYDMLPEGCVVLAAVSGGADSVCMLHWLANYTKAVVHVAHYNHHLRGEESDRDEEFVRDLCEKWKLPFHSGSGDVAAQAKASKAGMEETARKMRYGFLYQTAGEIGANRIATAHTADDNLETLLFNLTRGAGLQGLTGIPPRQGILIRPLLATPRKDVEEYLFLFDLPHVEDSTNADERYTRNALRHLVIPLLEKLNPALRENSMDTIRYLRADNDYLNALASDLSKKAVVEDGAVTLPASLISGAPTPVAVRVVRQLLGMTPGGSTDCTGAHLEAVLELCRSTQPSGEVHLPHGLTARRKYDLLVLTHRLPAQPLAPMALHQGENPVPGTGWTVVLLGPPWPGLAVRPRQTRDEITLPSGHKRSLKRLFIDRKIPRLSRDTIPIVADGDGVIAVAGLGPNTGHPRHQAVQIIPKERGEEP